MSKELETVYVDFGDISAQATIERLVELVGIEAVKSAIDEIAAQQSVHLTAEPSGKIETNIDEDALHQWVYGTTRRK